MIQNAEFVGKEIALVGKKLEIHLTHTLLKDYTPYTEAKEMARRQYELGEFVRAMNDWSVPYAGRPETAPEARAHSVLYRSDAAWFRVHHTGELDRFDGTAWHLVEKPEGRQTPADVLFRRVIFPHRNFQPPATRLPLLVGAETNCHFQ